MAHFLEHLVFKGGEKYRTYRDVNEAATGHRSRPQRLHQPRPRRVPHHRPRRARRRGRRPAHRLRRTAPDRRRGARPRARRGRPGDRTRQRPAVGHGRAPDRRGGVRRSPARPPGARSRRAHPRHVHARWRSSPSARAGGRRRAAARSWSATSADWATTARSTSSSAASRRSPQPEPYEPAPPAEPRLLVRERDSNQSHLRMSYRPAVDISAARASGRRWRSTRRCWAARWARGCSTRSASSGAWPIRCTRSRTRTRTCPFCSCRPAWSRRSASRPTGACARSSPNCASRVRPRRRSSAPERTRPARARSPSRTPVPSPGTRPSRRSSTARTSIPTPRSRASTRSRSTRWRRSPRASPDTLSVACVGPQHRRGAGVRLTRGAVLAGLTALLLTGCGGSTPSIGDERIAEVNRSPAGDHDHPAGRRVGRRRRGLGVAGRGRKRRRSGSQAGRVAGAGPSERNAVAAVSQGGAPIRRAGLRPDRASAGVRTSRGGRTSAGLGREALHDAGAAADARPRGAPAHGRCSEPAISAGTGSGTGTCTCAADGDPTFGDGAFNRVWEEGYGPTATQLVTSCATRASAGSPARLIGDASLFDFAPRRPLNQLRARHPRLRRPALRRSPMTTAPRSARSARARSRRASSRSRCGPRTSVPARRTTRAWLRVARTRSRWSARLPCR